LIIQLKRVRKSVFTDRMRTFLGKRIILVLFLFTLVPVLRAQEMEFGLMGGGCYYLGDLNPGKHFLNTQLAYGLLVRYNLDSRWAFKLSGTRGSVKGSSSSTGFLPERELNFSSPVTDISGVAEFNFFPYYTGSRRNGISPYIYAGISVFFFEPVSNGQSLRKLGTEGQNDGYEGRKPYSPVSFGIP
jgi:hypothetical protein